MTFAADGFGELIDLAKALGIVGSDGALRADWFNDPGKHISQMLRDAAQRDALSRFLATMMKERVGGPDPLGRTWIPIFTNDALSVSAVIETTGPLTHVGLGVSYQTTTPVTHTSASIPLVSVPAAGPIALALGTPSGRITLSSDITFDGTLPPPGQPALGGLALSVDVGTDGTSPKLSLALKRLQLPGESTPRDLVLGGAGPTLGSDALRSIAGLLQRAVKGASGPLGDLLALIGMTDDAAMALDVADVFVRGGAAWADWFQRVLTTPANLSAWLGRLATLIGHGAVVHAPLPTEHRVAWTVGPVAAEAVVRRMTSATGALVVELGVAAHADNALAVPGALEVESTLCRVTFDHIPSAQAMPHLSLQGRVGRRDASGPLLLDTGEPATVGAFRIGLAVTDLRTPRFVLAAHDVTIGSHSYPVLDLTNTQTLADVGTNAVKDLADAVLGHLGSELAPVRVLLGLDAPIGQVGWPVPLTSLPDLLSDPVNAVVAYHRRVLSVHHDGYTAVIGVLRDLMAATGVVAAVSGDGSVAAPWTLPIADGVALLAHAESGALHLGLGATHVLGGLPLGAPVISGGIEVAVARIALDGGESTVVPRVGASFVVAPRTGSFIFGPDRFTLHADALSLGFDWTRQSGLATRVNLPTLKLDTGAGPLPLSLPSISADGSIVGAIPWRMIEILAGHLLESSGWLWAHQLADLVGWGNDSVGGRLSLEQFAASPVDALGLFVRAMLDDDELDSFVRWLSLLISGPSGPGVPSGVRWGYGTRTQPHVLPFADDSDALRRAGLAWWGPEGDGEPDASLYRPGNLLAWLSATPGELAPPDPNEWVAALARPMESDPNVADLLADRGDLTAGFAALAARLTDTDGLVPAVNATFAGATVHEMEGVANHRLAEELDLHAVVGADPDRGTIFVTGPMSPARFGTVADDHVIDLSAADLTADRIDVSGLLSTDGPWQVRLCSRRVAAGSGAIVGDGLAPLAARLGRVVDAVVQRVAPGGNVTIVAHGEAGHAARMVAAEHTGVTRLVTVGTPHGGVGLDVLEQQPVAGVLQLLASILPTPSDEAPEHLAVELGRDLLAPLLAAYEAPAAGQDLAAPAIAPVLPSSVEAHCVVGRVDALLVNQAITGLVVRGLEALYYDAKPNEVETSDSAEADLSADPPDPALSGGTTVLVRSAVAPGVVHAEAALALAAGGLGDLTGQTPRLYVGVDIGRSGGWLAGGPDPSRAVGVDRRPSLRRVRLEFDFPLGPGDPATAALVFHDAESLGSRRRRWRVSHSEAGLGPDGSLHAEARVLLDRLAGALSPVPADGGVRDLLDLAAALGLIDVATPIVTGGVVRFSVDGVRRLLTDPGGLLHDARAAHAHHLADGLARLLGGAAVAADASDFRATVDGMEIVSDVAAGTLDVHTVGDGMAWKAGLRVGGRFTVDSTGKRGGSFSVNGTVNGLGLARFEVDHAGARLVALDGGKGVAPSTVLHPVPDVAAIARLAVHMLSGQVLHAALVWLREQADDVATTIDPLLRALGVLVDVGPTDLTPDDAPPLHPVLQLPAGLLADPFGWLRRGADGLAHTRLVDLVDAFADLVGWTRSGPGAVTLPYGMTLSATTGGDGRSRVQLALPTPLADTSIRTQATIGVRLRDGTTPAGVFIDALLGPAGAGPLPSSGRVAIGVSPDGITMRLLAPVLGIDLPLIPAGPGLNDIAATAAGAATRALPFVLDAISGLAPAHPAHDIGVALGAVGDALDLRVGGKFSSDRIQQLAGSPGPQLAQRLAANLTAALHALGELLKHATPAAALSWVSTPSTLTLATTALGGTFSLAAALPAGPPTGVILTTSITGAHPLTGATTDLSVSLDSNGLAEARALFAVSHAAGLSLGPLTLAPLIELAVGANPIGGSRIVVGFSINDTQSLRGVLRLGPTPTFAVEATGGTVADVVAKLLLPLAADAALGTDELAALLKKKAFSAKPDKVGQLLEGVLLVAGGQPDTWSFDAGVLDTAGDNIWRRVLRLASNLGGLLPSIDIDPATIELTNTAGVLSVAVSLKPGKSLSLVNDGIALAIDVDGTWITTGTGQGIVIGLLDLSDTAHPKPKPSFAVRGVGLRLSKSSGPLLDAGLAVKEIGLRGFLAIDELGVAGAGGQLQLLGLSVGVGGGSGGDDKVASGILNDASNGGEKPRALFSPSLIVQGHRGAGPSFQLRTGEDTKPVWVRIQRSFGPVYLEQVGFQTTHANDRIASARIAVDGSLGLLGLEVAVQELALGIRWPQPNSSDPPPWNPNAWTVSLAGLAVSANTSGVSISGGLRRATDGKPDYLGMLSVRFGVYGISAYAGYGVFTSGSHEYTSLFIFGALNAPIGGPPAFFVTGIGLGVGVNRLLKVPDDLNQLPAYPLIQALDANSQVSVSPAKALVQLGIFFPPAEGSFWLAAGLSFTSFALIDCVVVVAVAVGDGLEITIMGLARAALPTTSFPIIQIELALLARFSSREGVLSIRAQLTDNSWLLTKDCRLTGGFAYVMWFAPNKNAGQFVLSLGGYHPSFHRDGYPEVPRLGFIWNVAGFLVIKGESYFALTSEAIMMGTRFEATLSLGPLWAYLRLGADGIVWFDPFKFEVSAFAELGAGVTLDIDLGWFGHVRITVSVHLHADVVVAGPELHGRATIDLGVASATISFGSDDDQGTPRLDYTRFAEKYLRPGGARMLTAVVGRGTLPPSVAARSKPPTGAADDPIIVLPEFSLNIATSAAANAFAIGSAPLLTITTSEMLAIGPMHVPAVASTVRVQVRSTDPSDAAEYASGALVEPSLGEFPKGVWAAQPQTDTKPIPSGDTISAATGVRLDFPAGIPTGTVPINSKRVEVSKRHPLPFLAEAVVRGVNAIDVSKADALVAAASTAVGASAGKAIEIAKVWATTGTFSATLSPLADKTFGSARSAPPRLVPLTAGMVTEPTATGDLAAATVNEREPVVVGPPSVIAHLRLAPSGITTGQPRTTAQQMANEFPTVTPPRLADVAARHGREGLVAQLLRSAPAGLAAGATMVAAVAPPLTRRAGTAFETRSGAGVSTHGSRITRFTDALGSGIDLLPGDVLVVERLRPGADTAEPRPALSVDGGLPVRVVTIDSVGAVSRDVAVAAGSILLPTLTARVALFAGSGRADGPAGWHTATALTQVSRRSLVGPGCTIITDGLSTVRDGAGVATAVVHGADITRGFTFITTRFVHGVTAVAVMLEPVDGAVGPETLELGLVGASRVLDAEGEPVPPVIVVGGDRTTAVYAVVPTVDPAERVAPPINVTIASSDHWHLAGVVGLQGTVDALAARLSERGVDGVIGNVVTEPEGVGRVAWIEPAQAPPTDRFKEVGN